MTLKGRKKLKKQPKKASGSILAQEKLGAKNQSWPDHESEEKKEKRNGKRGDDANGPSAKWI